MALPYLPILNIIQIPDISSALGIWKSKNKAPFHGYPTPSRAGGGGGGGGGLQMTSALQPGLTDLVGNLKDRFSHDAAHD